MDRVTRIARRARRRRRVRRTARAFGRGMVAGAVLAAALVAVDRWFGLGLAWWWLAGGPGVVVAAFTARAALRRDTLEAAAHEVDERLGLSDRLGSGVWFGAHSAASGDGAGGPFERLALADAERAAGEVDLSKGAPITLTRVHRWWPVLTAAAVAMAVWLPARTADRASDRPASAQEIAEREEAQERIRETREDAAMALEERPELFDDATRKELEALRDIENELAAEGADPEEAGARASESLNDAAERLEREAEAAERELEAARRRFENAPGDPAGEALAEGDFERAAEELEAMREAFENADGAEREAMRERLRDLADSIDASGGEEGPSDAERLREEGLSPEAAERVAEEQTEKGVREALEREGADPLEAERVAERLSEARERRAAEERSRETARQMQEALRDAAEQPPAPEQNAGQQDPGQEPGQEPGQQRPSQPQGPEQQGQPQEPGQQGQSQSRQPGQQPGQQQGQPQPQGQQPPSGSPQQGQRQQQDGLARARDAAQRMRDSGQAAADQRTAAERLREGAQRISARPDSRGGERSGQLADRAPQNRAEPGERNDALRTDSIDARQRSDSTRVRAEVEAEGPATARRGGASDAEAARALREAAPSAERTLENQGVPARYRDLVRRYFRHDGRASSESEGEELAPGADDPGGDAGGDGS